MSVDSCEFLSAAQQCLIQSHTPSQDSEPEMSLDKKELVTHPKRYVVRNASETITPPRHVSKHILLVPRLILFFIFHTEASEASDQFIPASLISVIKPTWLHSRTSLTRPSARLLSAPLNTNVSEEANKLSQRRGVNLKGG